MNILVTGAAGFIGYNVTQKLLAENHKVIGLDNFNDYYDISLKKYRINKIQNPNFKFYSIDIEDYKSLDNLFKGNEFDAVINLAARAGVRYSLENPFVYMSTNATGTLNLLELMKNYKVKKFVLASSSSLYAGAEPPFNENLPVNEPISQYAASKKSAEMLAHSYHHLYNTDVSILRYFTVYGPAGRPDMSYFKFIKNIMENREIEIYGDGKQKRDFTYIDDIANGTVAALKPLGYQIINLGGGMEPVSIIYMIRLIEHRLEKTAKIIFKDFHNADMKLTSASIEKAHKILKWKPKTEFEIGILKTCEWFIDNKNFILNLRI